MIDQTQLENKEYFSCLGSMIAKDAVDTCGIVPRIAVAVTEFSKIALFTRKLDLNLKHKMVLC